MEQEVPIRFEAYSRFLNKKHLKGKKADILVCGPENYGWNKEIKCEECGKVCYYTEDNLDLKKENVKKICIGCALKDEYKKDLSKEMIEILEGAK